MIDPSLSRLVAEALDRERRRKATKPLEPVRVFHPRLPIRGKSGLRGVYITRHGTYQAILYVDGKRRGLGNFKSKEAASARVQEEIDRFNGSLPDAVP